MPDAAFLIIAGIILIITGFLLVAFGMMASIRKEEKVKGSGVILIGPVPIVFGSDKRFALIAMILAIVLMLLAIIFLK